MIIDLTVMTLTGFLFLLLFTGGSTSSFSELLGDHNKSNHRGQYEESGSTSSDSELDYRGQLEESGNISHYLEQPDDYMYFFDYFDDFFQPSDSTPCSHQDVLNYLNLTKNNDLYSMTRPVKNHKTTLSVHLLVILYAILDVNEKDQQFVSYIWIHTRWKSDYINWDPKQFCDIKRISVPTEALWKPDLAIEEMTEKDKAPPSPYLTIQSHGHVGLKNDQVLVSTCRMQVYKFPFDFQSCDLSFKSVIHSDKEIQLVQSLKASDATKLSHDVIRTQSEWLFINMTIKNQTASILGFNQSMIIYTITMKRRSVLYIVNFMLPILFFLCLDLSSFLISDSGGEKLSFKVTVLLAVTVMQLILNDILPSSSNRIPLIAMYCIGTFGLMMLSLMETILVMYLIEKDKVADKDQSLTEDYGVKRGKVSFNHCCRGVNKSVHCDMSPDETPSGLLPVTKEGSSSQLMGESCDIEKLSHELREVEKTVTLLLNSRKEEEKPGYWTRVTKTINKVFFVFYIIAAIGFISSMFIKWNTSES